MGEKHILLSTLGHVLYSMGPGLGWGVWAWADSQPSCDTGSHVLQDNALVSVALCLLM